jgi:hypothetical protein
VLAAASWRKEFASASGGNTAKNKHRKNYHTYGAKVIAWNCVETSILGFSPHQPPTTLTKPLKNKASQSSHLRWFAEASALSDTVQRS